MRIIYDTGNTCQAIVNKRHFTLTNIYASPILRRVELKLSNVRECQSISYKNPEILTTNYEKIRVITY